MNDPMMEEIDMIAITLGELADRRDGCFGGQFGGGEEYKVVGDFGTLAQRFLVKDREIMRIFGASLLCDSERDLELLKQYTRVLHN